MTFPTVGKAPQVITSMSTQYCNPFAVLASIEESSDDDSVLILAPLPENPFDFVSSVVTTQDMMHSLSHAAVTPIVNQL